MNWTHFFQRTAFILSVLPGMLCALPKGSKTVSGTASSKHTDAGSLEITVSDKAIINYKSFNIGENEKVVFKQPGKSSCVLNRVNGQDPSAILGSLQANGKVFLINSRGVYFGPSASVDVGSLIASTLDINDHDFLQEKYSFFLKPGSETTSIHNAGVLSASAEGAIALLAPYIRNDGVIRASQGRVVLGSAEKLTLDFSGDGLLHFIVEEELSQGGIIQAGLIDNPGGEIYLHLHTAKHLIQEVVNADGVLAGEQIVEDSGKIQILSSSSILSKLIEIEGSLGSQVALSGTVDVSNSEGTGGSVLVLAEAIELRGSTINASGRLGGGTVLIGGDYQGQGEYRNALTIHMDEQSIIYADAKENGNGGKVILWADDRTVFNGQISVQGGTLGGDGGLIETSGKQILRVDTGRVSALAPKGKIGSWLLDPLSITIQAGGTGTTVQAADCTDVATALTITAATINAALADVTLCASSFITQNAGQDILMSPSITFQSPINTFNASVTTGANISFYGGSIAFNGPVTAGGDFIVTLATDMISSAGASITAGGDMTITSANNITSGALIDVGGDMTITSANNIVFNGAVDVAQGAGVGDMTITSANDITATALIRVDGALLIGSARNVTAAAITATSMTQSTGTGTTQNTGNWNIAQDITLSTDTITFGSTIGAVNMTMQGASAITSLGGLLTPSGIASFNALNGRVGTEANPIQINSTQTIYAGAKRNAQSPLVEANFQGTPFHAYLTPSPAVLDIPSNPACPIAFNGIIIKSCSTSGGGSGGSSEGSSALEIPARDLYEPWVYSIDNSLGSNFWFFRDWTDANDFRSDAHLFWMFPHLSLKKPQEKSTRSEIDFWRKYKLWPFLLRN